MTDYDAMKTMLQHAKECMDYEIQISENGYVIAFINGDYYDALFYFNKFGRLVRVE